MLEAPWEPRPYFHYSHLNLRRNPFGEATTEQRIQLAVANMDEIRVLFCRPKSAIQFIGDHGRGKTSHLLALKRELLAKQGLNTPYLRLRDDWRIPHSKHLLLDEGELLWRRPFWRLITVQSLAISTHRDLSGLLRAFGFSVCTIQIGAATSSNLREIFEKRIEWARQGTGPVPQISETTTKSLIERYGDDVRAMEDALYDHVEAMQENGLVEM